MKIYSKSEGSGAAPAWICGHWNGSPIEIGMGFRTEVGNEVLHYHDYREYYAMLEGSAELEVEGKRLSLAPGMVAMVEPGERHQVCAIGPAGASWIVIKERSEPNSKHLA